jgi:hypothetical protein
LTHSKEGARAKAWAASFFLRGVEGVVVIAAGLIMIGIDRRNSITSATTTAASLMLLDILLLSNLGALSPHLRWKSQFED